MRARSVIAFFAASFTATLLTALPGSADTNTTTDAPITCQTRFGAQPGTFTVTVTDDADPVPSGSAITYRINSPFKQTLPQGVNGTYRGGQVFYRIPAGLNVTSVTTQAPPGGSRIQASASKQGNDIVVTSTANVPIDGSTYPTPDLVVRGTATGAAGTQIRWLLPYRIIANVDITGIGPVDADCAPNNPNTVIGTTNVVAPANRAPVVQNLRLPVPQNTSKAVTLPATDPDGDAITFAVQPPRRGTLTGTPPNVVYTPDTDFVGDDSFTYTATDSKGASATATVSLLVYANAEGDTFPPAVTVTAPVHGAVYTPGEVVTAAFTCSDGESGIQSCTGSTAAGSAVPTTVGQHTFTVTAVDRDGNRATSVVSYRVLARAPVQQSYDAGPDPANVIPFDCTGQTVVPFEERIPATVFASPSVPEGQTLTFRFAPGAMSVPPSTMATNARFVFVPPVNGVVENVAFVPGTGSANVANSTAAIVDGRAVMTIPGPVDGGLLGATFTPKQFEVTIKATGAPTARVQTRFDRYQVRMTTGVAGVDIVTTDYDCPAGDADSANPVLTNTTIHDVTPPTVSSTSPVHGGRYLTGDRVLADYACSDAHTVTVCFAPVADGKPVGTATPGAKTFFVLANDAAGNVAGLVSSYKIFTPVVFTARFTSLENAYLQAAASFFKVPVQELPRLGVLFIRSIIEANPDATYDPIAPPPPDDRPYAYETKYLPNDAVRVQLEAARFNLNGDDYHWHAGRTTVFLYVLLKPR